MLSVIGNLFGNRNELLEIVSSLSEKNGELNTKNEEQNTIIHRQEEQIEEQRTIIHRHEDQIGQLKQKLQWFEGQFHLLRHKRFGASSEQTPAAQGNLFNEAEVIAEEEPAKEAELETITYQRKKPGRKALPEDLPRERRKYELPEEEQHCPKCGEHMHKMGEEVRSELNIIPAQVKVVEHVRFKYGCRNCEKNGDKVPIKIAEAPNPVIKKSYASPSSIAHVMTAKFVDGVPLCRQEKQLERFGIKISRSVLSDWALKGSEVLEPVYDVLHQIFVKRNVVHADETTLQVLKEPGRAAESKSYIWVYLTAERDGPPIVLYEYQATRAGAHPRKFLSGFSGYLHADGYSGYNKLGEPSEPDKLPMVELCGCWVHFRRKFDETLKAHPPGKRNCGRAKEAIDRINQLFLIERGLNKCTPEQRLAARQEKSRPVVDGIRNWMESLKKEVFPKSLLWTAITYGMNQWEKLTRFLDDGRIELSNNRAERCVRPFVIGRKNFLFCNTPRGAKASAVIYSIVETAKQNGVNPYVYLTYLFERLPNMDTSDAAAIEALLPWNVKLPK